MHRLSSEVSQTFRSWSRSELSRWPGSEVSHTFFTRSIVSVGTTITTTAATTTTTTIGFITGVT